MSPQSLQETIAHLRRYHGRQKPPPSGDPWHFILWENVAYLADDARRQQALAVLREQAGVRPMDVFAAPNEALLAVACYGIMPEMQAKKLRRCAQIAVEEFGGNLKPVLARPVPKARRALQKFPGIGVPGADRILLFCRQHAALPLESNGLRVLLRLGYGTEAKNYAATYRSVQEAIDADLKREFPWLIEAHQLLRRHGQEVCTKSRPQCGACPLAQMCPSCETADRS